MEDVFYGICGLIGLALATEAIFALIKMTRP